MANPSTKKRWFQKKDHNNFLQPLTCNSVSSISEIITDLAYALKEKPVNVVKTEISDYETLLNCTSDLLWSVSKDFKLIAANKAFITTMETLGYLSPKPGDELLLIDIFPKTLTDIWKACYRRALAGESFKQEIYAPVFNNLKECWTECSFNPVYKNETIVGIACSANNITEKKIAEEKSKLSELNYESLIEQATDGICIADASMKVVAINTSGCRLLGYTKEEFMKLTAADIFIAEDVEANPYKLEQLLSGQVITNERRLKRKNGKVIACEISGKLMTDGRFVVFARDITERKKAAITLQAAYNEKDTILESIADGFFTVDKNWIVTYWNKEAEKILQTPKHKILGLYLWSVFADGINSKSYNKYYQALETNQVVDFEDYYTTLDKWYAVSAYPSAKGLSVYFKDITERKNSDTAIKKAYQEKETLLERIDDGFFAADKNLIITYWNKRAEILLNSKKENVIGKTLQNIFANPVYMSFYNQCLKAIEQNSTTYFEEFSNRTNKWFAVSAYGSTNGLSVYFKDVTENKNAENQIKESELRYRSLIEQAADTICIANTDFKFTDINPSGCRTFGYSREEFILLSFTDVLLKEDLITNPIRIEDLTEGKYINNERRIVKKDGSILEIELSAKMMEDGNIIMFGRDITERKKAARLIAESEDKYRSLFEQNVAGVYQSTANGVILNCNHAFAKMLKYNSPAELLNLNASALYFSPGDRNEFIEAVISQKKITNYESVLKCKDGSPQYFIENISLRKNKITGEDFFDGILIDITEKKQGEMLLKQSNERYNLISKATNDMVWDWDLVTDKVYRNKEGWKKIFKTADDEIPEGSTAEWNSRIHKEDKRKVKQLIDEIQTLSKNFYEVECRMLRNDGTYAYIHDRGNILRNEHGKPVRIIGATQDITARKEAELFVTQSEKHFRSLVQNSSDLTGVLNHKGYYLYCSPAITKILGYNPEYMLGKNAFAFVHPKDISLLKAHLEKKDSTDNISAIQFRFKNLQGEWRWLESKITDMSQNQEVHGYIFNSRDITERKIAEEEIKKLSIIARETVNAVIITNPQGEIVWVNEGFTGITGFEPEEVIGKKPGDFLQGSQTDQAVVSFMREKIKKIEPFECDILNYSKQGSKYWLRIQCQPQFDETGKLKYFFAIETDITKEKEAGQILRASEERYRYLFNNNPASIFIWDINDLKILKVNDSAVRLYGYSQHEFITKTILEISLPKDENKIMQFVSNAIRKPDFRFNFTCEHVNKAGEKMFMNISSHRIEYKGRPVVLALATDISEKVKLEKELEKERLHKQQQITEAVITAQEKERQELGAELHDNINQILAGSRLYLSLAKKQLKIVPPYLQETDGLINSAINEIRNLSHTLIPPSLNESELLGAIANIIDVTQKTSNIMISLQAYNFSETGMNDKLKLSIYRIVQEQLNNILKHAAAKKVIVQLQNHGERTILSIKDDGIGFDTSKKANGVGLLNIKTRASLFNGHLSIVSFPGKGCEVKVTFN